MDKSVAELLVQTELAAKKAGSFIQKEAEAFDRSRVEVKGLNSLVSYVDQEAEAMIVRDLADLVPDAGFITEEDSVDNQEKDLTWVIDPLDGTTNFIQGIPHYSVSLALKKGPEILLGVVYDPAKDEMFSAAKGQGARLNGKPIHVSHKELIESILVTGFPYEQSPLLQAHIKMLGRFLIEARGIRRLGSAALDLAYVASGRIDAYYEHKLNIWDIAAGVLIVQEAGGVVSSYSEIDDCLQTGSIIAASKPLHVKVHEIIQICIRETS